MVLNLGLWLEECYLKYKRQKWDFCEESTVRQFATNFAAVKFAEHWMSNHFLEEILATLVGPRDQNAPRKTDEAGPAA